MTDGRQVRTVVVVGAAILDGAGHVLTAKRREPPALAGYWELPGGKVDPGETDEAALIRECAEELDVVIEPIDRFGADLPIGEHGILRVWTARITSGELRAVEHDELRWVDVDELPTLNWLPADQPLIPALQQLLTRSP